MRTVVRMPDRLTPSVPGTMAKTLQFCRSRCSVLRHRPRRSRCRSAMLQAEDARPTTEAGLAPLTEALEGQRPAHGDSRDRAIRTARDDSADRAGAERWRRDSRGSRERAGANGAHARGGRRGAEAAARARGHRRSLNTWESWGEIAAALGRLPYDTAAQVPRPKRCC